VLSLIFLAFQGRLQRRHITFDGIYVTVAVEDIYYQVDNDDMLAFLKLKQEGQSNQY
jgi:hypothetical protein